MKFLNMRTAGKLAGAAFSLSVLAGCTTQGQADGSTKVNVSVSEALGLNKPAAAPAAAAPTVAATMLQSMPKGIKLSAKSRAVLVKMLECKEFVNGDVETGMELAKVNGWGDNVQLEQPVMVFGFPVSRISLSGDGSEGTYRGYFAGVSKQQIIKAAKLKLSKKDKNYYFRDAKVGQLSFKPADPEMSLKCYIDTEGAYDEGAAPVKKKKK